MIQETSREAYHSVEDELGRRQREVLDVVETRGPISNYDIAEILQRPVNTITPRVLEVRQKGLLQEAFRQYHPITKRLAIYWTTHRGQRGLFI